MQNQLDEFEFYKILLDEGVSFEYKRLSLCLLERNMPKKHIYQVYCDNFKVKFAEHYNNINDAVAKFLELKRKIK